MAGIGLQQFLENHKADNLWTHTSQKGGKYFIPDEHKDQFYELYVESINDQEKQYLVEKTSDIGPLRIDFDFIYNHDVTKHQHTQKQVISFCKAYLAELRQFLKIDTVEMMIMEKRKPTLDSKKNKIKSGIHIVVPDVCTHKFIEQRVRRNLLKTIAEHFADLPISETWDKIYDEAVTNRTVPWSLYGSRKNDPNSLPYLISYVLKFENEEPEVLPPPPLTVDLVKKLSLVRDDTCETEMTEEGKKNYGGLNKSDDVVISGGKSLVPARGRPLQRKDGEKGAGIDVERKHYIKQHVMNLKKSRYEKYEEWVQVGICLRNIHYDLLDVFLDFSSQYDKYNEPECIDKWKSLTVRNDGDRLGEGTLRYWSREDNPKGYVEIESSNVNRLVLAACSCTEHDVACVIHAKFRDHYVCCDFGKNVWYRWAGHIWKETDKGIDLQLKLSKQIADVFFKKMQFIVNEMANNNLTSCSADGKANCEVCEYCQLERQREGLNKIYTKLKTTKFKADVMKECRELFFDEQFTEQVDSNKDLIAFNNGVLDLVTFEFRDGKPEDYISFSTKIDYDPEKSFDTYESWPLVDTFIKQVLPDPEVRDYFIKHLATNLFGGNNAQKFHIMTGNGSNGKSMIMNLVSTALGDYACTVPIALFTQKRAGSGSAAPEVVRLKGRRLVSMQEPDEAVALNSGLMKLVSSGEKMYARDLFKSGCEFEVQAKFHLACNDKPKINTTDGGTWRRLVVINFTSKFVINPVESYEFPLDESIQYSVVSRKWATPFLSYLVSVLKEGKGLRKLVAPDKVLEYTSEYRNDNDGIAKFISEKLILVKEGDEIVPTDKTTLKRLFKQWMSDNDLRLSPADMEKRVETTFGKYHRGGWTTFRVD